MTSKERLLKVINGDLPDHVPASPDISNMVPARMTGLPFWDIYLYKRIPSWKAYIEAVKYFGFDSLMDGYAPVRFEDLGEIDHDWTEAIVRRTEDRIITQCYRKTLGHRQWSGAVTVYYRDNPPTAGLKPRDVGLPDEPESFEDVRDVTLWPEGAELLSLVKREMGDRGLVGVFCGTSLLLHNMEEIYDYYDNPGKYLSLRDETLECVEKRFHRLMALPDRPDFICTGGSGTLVFQSPAIFRELALPIVQKVTSMCKRAGIPSHIHSCGPETELIKIAAEETDLTVIDPLEIPPMGDCNLKELKRLYGHRLVLKGNLHTTDVMLRGTPEDVARASRQAIDDGAAGGRFILSTGDQCGRDTPDENLFAMIETARTYGKY